MPFTTIEDLEARLASRLDPLEDAPPDFAHPEHYLDSGAPRPDRPLTPAAVLVPLVRRPEGWTMLLTQRTQTMPTHAGQVAFPGGRIQAEDGSAVAAALRETREETGLAPSFVQPIGRFGAYVTGTGYTIAPVVAYVAPGFDLSPDPREVDQVFEAPLSFVLNPMNHQRHSREFEGRLRSYYAMPYGDHYIWGVTAGMIRALYERLYG